MTLPTSYATEYADHRRASRVGVAPRHYRYVERLVPADRHPLRPAPDAVLIGPGPEPCWGLTYGDRMLVVDAAGTREYLAGTGRWIAALDRGLVRLGNRVWTTPDSAAPEELGPMGVFDEPCVQTVARWDGEIWITVAQRRQSFAPNETMVRVRGNGPRKHDPTAPRWAFDWLGEGTAAIADDGTVVVASIDRSVHVLQHPADPAERAPRVRARIDLPHEPYAVSAIDDGFVIASAIESGAPDPTQRIGRLHGRGAHRFAPGWRTEVRRVDADLRTLWMVELDFAVLQPAIDGADGRVVVAGRGLACLEHGAVRWAHATDRELLASAFVDGTLAIGSGAELVIVDRDGRPVQTLPVPEARTIVTAPAIGPDGSLAFGTSSHTYVVPAVDA